MSNIPEKPKDLILQTRNIINDVYDCRYKKAINVFNESFKEETEQILSRLTNIYEILTVVVNYTDPEIVGENNLTLKSILWEGANSLLCALQVIRQGYFVEPDVLIRKAAENLALAIHLFDKEEDFKLYENNKLFGHNCIGTCKKFIPTFGQAYGILSKMSHPNKSVIGTYLDGDDAQITFVIGGSLTKEKFKRTYLNLGSLAFMASVYESGAELMFYDYINTHSFWRKSSNELVWKMSDDEKEKHNKIQEILKKGIK